MLSFWKNIVVYHAHTVYDIRSPLHDREIEVRQRGAAVFRRQIPAATLSAASLPNSESGSYRSSICRQPGPLPVMAATLEGQPLRQLIRYINSRGAFCEWPRSLIQPPRRRPILLEEGQPAYAGARSKQALYELPSPSNKRVCSLNGTPPRS